MQQSVAPRPARSRVIGLVVRRPLDAAQSRSVARQPRSRSDVDVARPRSSAPPRCVHYFVHFRPRAVPPKGFIFPPPIPASVRYAREFLQAPTLASIRYAREFLQTAFRTVSWKDEKEGSLIVSSGF